jgi:uncharacterized protein (UPF0264 family)
MHRIKVIVALRDKNGKTKLFEFTNEGKADKFIDKARIEGFEVTKGKLE